MKPSELILTLLCPQAHTFSPKVLLPFNAMLLERSLLRFLRNTVYNYLP